MCQAYPAYVLDEDEASDFKLRVMAEIHQIHERVRVSRLAEMFAQMLGAGDG